MKEKNILLLFLSVLCITLMATSISLFASYKHLEKTKKDKHSFMQQEKNSDVSSIRAWMTFDYINHAFHLPPALLQKELNIREKRYPKITLHQVAKIQKEETSSFLKKTQESITTYLHTTSSTTSWK